MPDEPLARAVRELRDREAIRDLVARYAQGVAFGDGVAVVDLFTEDAVFSTWVPGETDGLPDLLHGREELRAFYSQISPGAALPYVHNQTIAVDGDIATGVCMLEVRLTIDGRTMDGAGYYQDRFRREAAGWKFAERRCRFFHVLPVGEDRNQAPASAG